MRTSEVGRGPLVRRSNQPEDAAPNEPENAPGPPMTLDKGARKLRPVKLNIIKLRAEQIFIPADEDCDDRRAD
jgi:hypothetical protein